MDVDVSIMERILNLNTYHTKQLVYQGFNTTVYSDRDRNYSTSFSPENQYLDDDTLTTKNHIHEHFEKNNLSSSVKTNLNLERLWYYTCYLIYNRNVSCLCWNKQNHVR